MSPEPFKEIWQRKSCWPPPSATGMVQPARNPLQAATNQFYSGAVTIVAWSLKLSMNLVIGTK
jgi:hypothetical protein